MDSEKFILDFEVNLEEYERKLFKEYRKDLRNYLKDVNIDDVYELTDGNLLSSLVLIKSFDSQERLNKLTTVLIIFTVVLVVFTIVLAFLTYLLYLKG